MKRSEVNEMRALALEYYNKAGIVLTDEEKANIEVADLGLGMVKQVGLEIRYQQKRQKRGHSRPHSPHRRFGL